LNDYNKNRKLNYIEKLGTFELSKDIAKLDLNQDRVLY